MTPNNFLNVLAGKKGMMDGIGSGKVIASGPNDRIFVFIADLGAPGLLAFPSGRVLSKFLNLVCFNEAWLCHTIFCCLQLYKNELAEKINYMYTNKKYGQV